MDKKRLSLLLMSDQEDSILLALCLVYRTINANPGITINQICKILYDKFFISRVRVEGAIATLVNSQSFNCVSTYEEKVGVVHLRCKNTNFEQFKVEFCERVPEACLIEVPKYERHWRQSNGYSALKKV